MHTIQAPKWESSRRRTTVLWTTDSSVTNGATCPMTTKGRPGRITSGRLLPLVTIERPPRAYDVGGPLIGSVPHPFPVTHVEAGRQEPPCLTNLGHQTQVIGAPMRVVSQ